MKLVLCAFLSVISDDAHVGDTVFALWKLREVIFLWRLVSLLCIPAKESPFKCLRE